VGQWGRGHFFSKPILGSERAPWSPLLASQNSPGWTKQFCWHIIFCGMPTRWPLPPYNLVLYLHNLEKRVLEVPGAIDRLQQLFQQVACATACKRYFCWMLWCGWCGWWWWWCGWWTACDSNCASGCDVQGVGKCDTLCNDEYILSSSTYTCFCKWK